MDQIIAPNSSQLPDIAASRTTAVQGTLSWVGMSQIQAPILISSSRGELLRQAALVDAYVSLDAPEARGIHMSRLYREVQEVLEQNAISLAALEKATESFLKTHQGLSERAKVSVRFEALLQRESLKSGLKGWRSYPITLRVEQFGASKNYFISTEVVYSSTCPASAALARQLMQDQFVKTFKLESSISEGDVVSAVDAVQNSVSVSAASVKDWLGRAESAHATPHAQRSLAKVEVQLTSAEALDFEDLIDVIENTLQTPVQTVVKREDEQEFARRNGAHLMFCEDAARQVQACLQQIPSVLHFQGEFRHVESLHPHDAVAFISK